MSFSFEDQENIGPISGSRDQLEPGQLAAEGWHCDAVAETQETHGNP